MKLTPESSGVYIEYSPPINYSHSVTFQASRDGGTTWREVPCLTCVPVPDDGLVRVYDFTAPLNSRSWYRALSFRREGDTLVASPYWSEWGSAQMDGLGWWLK